MMNFRDNLGCSGHMWLGNGMFNNGGGHPMIVPMLIIMAVLAAVTIVAVILIVRKLKKSSKQHANDAAMEELKIRFVKGEITEDEYERMKKVINL